MKKVVINSCFGGFSLSHEAMKELHNRKAKCLKYVIPEKHYGANWREELELDTFLPHMMYSKIITEDKKVCIFDHNKRDDNELIEVISRLGSNANGAHAKLKIVEIPDDVEYFIEDHDGIERIVEKHRHWE